MLGLIIFGLLAGGCSRPTEVTRDNRRILDAILTAVTLRNRDELLKDKELLQVRLTSGQISTESHAAIKQAVDNAEAGNWTAAEKRLYEIRKQSPFPK